MEDLSKDPSVRLQNYQAVVGGVSAGGLAALKSLLGTLPADFALALVIVQHLHPQQDDFLVEHLVSVCRLPVKEAEEKEAVKSGVVYLAPANYHLLIEADRTFSLSTDEKVNFSRPSIDVLFETAAEAYGTELIGVILTGASRDGAVGLRRIKEKRGLTIVQDPKSAEYPAMPLAALEETSVDHVLMIDRIGLLLSELGRSGPAQPDGPGSQCHG
jgi:two-component system, chemotaxis family, protein-glutamate methylesterase/glutaminase